VVVASGFGMFNRSFHWVLQMNLIILDRGEEGEIGALLGQLKESLIIAQHHGFSIF